MLTNSKDMFDALLLAIRKEGTSSIYPFQAIVLLNEASIEWLKENTKLVDLNQREIEDIQDVWERIEVSPTSANKFDLSTVTPKYFQVHGHPKVKISDIDSCIDNSEYQPLYLFRGGKRNAMQVSPYRRPKPTKLYYDIRQGNIEVYGGVVTKFYIEYYSYITEITNVTTTPNDMSMYSDYILREIVDVAERIYIERTQNERYQSQIEEMQIKKQGE